MARASCASKALHAGSDKAVQRRRDEGRLLARERAEKLCDPGSFVELDRYVRHRESNFGMMDRRPYGDAVVTGYGTVFGRKVFVFSQDFTVFGGSLSEVFAEKICKVMDMAVKLRLPGDRHQRLRRRADPGGRRLARRLRGDLLAQRAGVGRRPADLSLVMGPCAGGAVYSPAMTDFVFMVEGSSYMFITGPDVVKTVTGEEVTFEELGGAATHASKSGVAHFTSPDEEACLEDARYLLSFLPQNNDERPPYAAPTDPVDREDARARHARPRPSEQAVRHARRDQARRRRRRVPRGARALGGEHRRAASRGSAATRSASSATSRARSPACSTSTSSNKAARFVRTCDAFNIPLVTFVDVPGFLPGTAQEWGGIIRHGAKLLYAYCEATVPKLTVITRKAYGGAYDVMSSKHVRADFNFAWPTAEVAVMGPEGAVNIVFRHELETPTTRRRAAPS